MIQMVLVLSVLGSYVVVMSDEVNLTATIPPGYALQDYLCSGPLKSNTTVVLDDGEHRISSGPPCDISNGSSITIKGSSSMKNTTVRCEGEGRLLQFSLVQKLTLERMTFIGCGIQLISISNTVVTKCIFQSSSMGQGAIRSQSSNNIAITSCVFQNNIVTYGRDGGAVMLNGSTGDISITNCTFLNNSATNYGGGAVMFDRSQGDVSITYCTFQNNSATSDGGGGAILFVRSQGDVSITYCTFQNNSATNGDKGKLFFYVGGAVLFLVPTGNVDITYCTFQNTTGGAVQLYESTGNVNIANCTFQNNGATYGGGAVMLYKSLGDISITNGTFENNSATYGYSSDFHFGGGGGGAVLLVLSIGNVRITYCTFVNSATNGVGDNGDLIFGGGAVLLAGSQGNVSITYCTFQNNSATDGDNGTLLFGVGGALFFIITAGNVDITYCTFQNNSAYTTGGAVALYGPTGNVNITNCTFENNSATYGGGGAVLLLGSEGDVSITNGTFENNSATYGYNSDLICDGGGAVIFIKPQGDVRIAYSTFQNNIASDGDNINGVLPFGGGGAVLFFASVGNVEITYCTFLNNSATYGGAAKLLGGGGAVLSVKSSGVSITNCTFQNNIAAYDGNLIGIGGGGAVLLMMSTGNVDITNCKFQNNGGAIGGGAVGLYGIQDNASTTNCTFHNNSANVGGGMTLMYASTVNVDIINCTFIENTAGIGAALYASNSMNLEKKCGPLGLLILQEVVIKDNHCSIGGAIYFDGVKVDIFGNTPTGSQFSSNSAQGAIQGQNGYLLLHGNITFTKNRGVNGGAISLSNNAPLYFYEGCRVEFSRNIATGFGGAVYNHWGRKDYLHVRNCIIRFVFNHHTEISQHNDFIVTQQSSNFSITFTDNHAQQGGHAVYATPIYLCTNCFDDAFTPCESTFPSLDLNLTSYMHFTITPPEDVSEIPVISSPVLVHLCGCSDPTLCNVTSQYQGKVTTYPGGTVRLYVTSDDFGSNLSPSVVYTLIEASDITSQNITLGPRQEAQWIGTVCGMIEYQIYGPEMASFQLLLFNNHNKSSAIIEVKLLPCEPGFTLSSTGVIKCVCSLFFTSLGVVCDASDGTVTRNNKFNWVGVYNNTLPALASTCPLNYCNSTINKQSLGRPGDLCNGERSGILCGHCHGNKSVTFGSSKCQVCTDMWLITLVMFAVLGGLLVATLFFLNLTVTQGTLYGLIFYANIIQVNTSIFFSQSILSPMKVIVSFLNFDLGLPLCFYDGMDDADKAGLQFVFPAYLLILTMTVIVLCHYCLQISPTSSTSSCWYRFPIMIGERAVGVLSTLIYLSYSKLLRTVIDVFTYSTIHLPTGDMYVWFYDGNVNYLHDKHTVLFVVSTLTCTLFLLPYTFALTFIPIIERYSEHNRLFNYLHKKANKMKPMNDAHYAPYKGEWQWWLGARLWLLVVMYSLNPVYSSDKPSLLLSIQATVVILFTIAQAGIKPFGQSHQQTDRCTRYIIFCNQLHNILDLFYLINYIALALSMSYILEQSSDQAQMTVVSVGVLVGLYVVVLMVTVLYHLIVVILKACMMYDKARENIKELFEKKYELMVPIELDVNHTTNTVSTTTVSVNYGLREPLCED